MTRRAEIAAAIRCKQEALEMPDSVLAKRSGLSESTIRRILKGKNAGFYNYNKVLGTLGMGWFVVENCKQMTGKEKTWK